MNLRCWPCRLRLCVGHVLVLMTVCGCASLAPAVPPPWAVAVPSDWSAAGAAGAGASNINGDALAAWWQRFDDTQLTDLVSRALSSNTGVNSAQAALRQAQALRNVAASALRPTLGATASAQRGTAGGDSTGNRFQAAVDAQWVPDLFGARRGGLDASDAVAAASAASLGDTQVQVAAEVALNYILLRSVQARWAIANDNLASQRDTLQITDWRQQAGLVTALEVDQARAAAAQTQALLPALQISIQQTAHALAVLVGQPPAALLVELRATTSPASTPTPTTQQAPTPAQATSAVLNDIPETRGDLVLSIPAETLRQRADVRAAEFQVAAALARVGQAQAQRWPSFAIGGSIGLNAVSLAALTNGALVLSSVLASVSLPVFDGGAARAQVRAQEAALEQAQQVYRAAVLGALKDVENALVALNNDRLRLASLRVAADAAANAALLARQRFSSGLVDFQTVLETQRNQLATQDSVVNARADVGRDQVRLFTALGGGWHMPISADRLADLQPATTR
jgi:outer membrane protein, multidrug efflux system